MSKIQIMSDILANKIAAGEVVEKTMNVVKELVENSIDAQATEIKIDLIDSGIKEIKVTDDGNGMDKEDALLAFSRHATSKLMTEDDLFNIDSLGFRGEALPSIASVSHVILKTCNDNNSTIVEIDGGVTKEVKSAPLRKGTTIIVTDLFYNTPVRLKYLKNQYVELANITEYVNKMALSYPNIKFNLTNNDKVLLSTDGSNRLLKVINDIYGISVTKKMIEIENKNYDYSISGYISYPEIVKSNRNAITTLVNGRVIKNNEIIKTITDAYHTYIAVDKFPIVVIQIEVDPVLIDVNVHPTKMDVKFSKIDKLKELINETISKKLSALTLIPNVENITKEDEQKLEINLNIGQDYKKDEILPKKQEYETITLDFDVKEETNEYKEDEPVNRIKKIYPVGLVHGTYIVGENEDGMYLIDQHAANERINYEIFLKAMGTHDKTSMDLLIPLTIEIPNSEYLILKENFAILDSLGIIYEEFGLNTLLIRTVPIWLPKNNLEEALRKIIDIIVVTEDFNSEKFTEKIAITLACKLSIKANDRITLEDMEVLLERLRNCNNPFTCPHGRPTIITYTKYELEKLFKRAM